MPFMVELLLLLIVALNTFTHAAELRPVKVFILAGQSNMEGQAVVDLTGKDYNEGKGTLAALMNNPAKAAQFSHLRGADGKWTVRDDVWVRYQREERPLLKGPLGVGYAVYGGTHHFGAELQFGHVVGDRLENPVLLIKTAWGGKSLYRDFRPPSSGGETGPYYQKMLEEVRTGLANLATEFPSVAGRGHELAGFVWWHGWNDGCEPAVAVPQYEQNLANLINDVRRELSAPQLPVVIGELTGPWVDAPPEWEQLRKAQAAVASKPEFAGTVTFVPTRKFVRQPEDSPNPGHGHHEFGNAETYFLVGDALGKAMVSLLEKTAAAPQKKLPLEGEVFTVQGRTAFLVPGKAIPDAKTKPWVWYAPTLPGLPGPEEQWMFERFRDAGISIAGIDVGESYGSPDGRALFTALYEALTAERGLSKKPVLLGRSRGGLMTLCWAAENADRVGGFAGIYPVCSLTSYPGIEKAAPAYKRTPQELTAQLADHNPVDRLATLAKAKVPLFAIHGDVDTVVPLEANSGLVKSRYEALGGTMQLIVPKGQGHNMWTGFFQCAELVDFVKANAK
jgi:pimeloyl-ACP methyl ester carboxylesterase